MNEKMIISLYFNINLTISIFSYKVVYYLNYIQITSTMPNQILNFLLLSMCLVTSIHTVKVHMQKTITLTCCPQSYVFDTDRLECKCPTDKPYLENNLCVACNLPSTWDKTTNTCLKCRAGMTFDTAKNICVCPTVTPFNNGNTCT